MAELVSLTCGQCGGTLNVEKGHEIFDCPFCGADIDSFNLFRDDLLKQAETCLRRMDFSEASKIYENILIKDPNDFHALNGLVLCAGNVISVASLKKHDKLETIKTREMLKRIDYARTHALEDDKPYFDTLRELVKTAKEYQETKAERDLLSRENDGEFKRISDVDENRETTEKGIVGCIWGLGLLIALPFGGNGVVAAPLIVAALIIAIATKFERWSVLVLLGMITIAVVLYFGLRSLTDIKKIPYRKKMLANREKLGALSLKLSGLESEYMAICGDLIKFKPQERAAEKTREVNKTQIDTSTLQQSAYVCNKCGGLLLIDPARRLYECTSCGVAYGNSLLIEGNVAAATTALRKRDFKDADQRFVLELLVDPHNFIALCGRILCAGRWTHFAQMEVSGFRTGVNADDLNERVFEAIENSSGLDNGYFLIVQKLVSLIWQYDANRKAYNAWKSAVPAKQKYMPEIIDRSDVIKMEFDREQRKLLAYKRQ